MTRKDIQRDWLYALDWVRKHGYEICEQCFRSIDFVMWDRKRDEMVFVKVKVHTKPRVAYRTVWANRLKRNLFRKHCNEWRRINRWRGRYRCDVIEVFPYIKGTPCLDHITNVKM